MIVFIVLLALIVCSNIQFSPGGEFNDRYMERENTAAINGIFVILVVFSHYTQYAVMDGTYDEPYMMMQMHIGQMIVVPFLFYSGYGMMEAVKRRGKTYIFHRIPEKFWTLLLRFDIAVALFLIVDKALGIEYPTDQILLAFTSWTNVGNSNWYITAILLIYIFFFISFAICSAAGGRIANELSIVMLILLIIGCVYFQIRIGRESYTYNTMLLFPLGALYSNHKGVIERVVMKNDITYWITVCVCLGLCCWSYWNKNEYGLTVYTLWAAMFMIIIILLTMKVNFHNPALYWCGRHVFSIYILQRLPMLALSYIGLVQEHKYMSFVMVFCLTILISLLFELLTDRLILSIKSLFNRAQ